MNYFIFFLGKAVSFFSKKLNLGNGSTWPGYIALTLNKNFIKDVLKNSNLKVIFVIGTNGKTTTSKLIQTILDANRYSVITNSSGANLLNGIASSLILNDSKLKNTKKENFVILEIDENALPLISKEIEPNFLIALNLFRDQLDRYGEVNSISLNWRETIKKLKNTTFILNSDDPQIAYLGKNAKNAFYFGLEDKSLQIDKLQHASDSILCPKCNAKLNFSKYYFSHLGLWECKNCGLKRPTPNISDFNYYPQSGTYSIYNTLAAVLFAKTLGLKDKDITNALKQFKPAFGRQEKIRYKNSDIQIFLTKNPISFNESLFTIKQLKGENLLIILNDNIPDGLDVSWIWDVDLETILDKNMTITVSGTRKFDMALRLKYAGFFTHIADSPKDALDKITENLNSKEVLYILPNYSAMLQIRKILTGKKIL